MIRGRGKAEAEYHSPINNDRARVIDEGEVMALASVHDLDQVQT